MTAPSLDLESRGVGELLDAIAAKVPTPGGGAVASVTGALATALVGMVLAYTVGKKKYAEYAADHEDAIRTCARTRELLARLAQEDVDAYAAMNELMSLPEDDPRRVDEMPAVALAATQVPLAVAATACDLLRLCEQLATRTNRMLRSDLEIAAILARATADAAHCNVAINLPTLERLGIAGGIREEADALVGRAAALESSIREQCH